MIRGPWLARKNADDAAPDVLVPIPAILQQSKHTDDSTLYRLKPLDKEELPGWNPSGDRAGLRPLWLKETRPTEPAKGYLTSAGLRKFLNGKPVAKTEADYIEAEELYSRDFRTGIGISPDRLVAEDQQIYSPGFLALKPNVSFYAEIVFPAGGPASTFFDELRTMSLGGEGRHVTVRRLSQPFNWPKITLTEKQQKPFLLLTTPCPFKAGWKPSAINNQPLVDDQIVAAAVPGSIPFSGWDMANRCPKPTRFAAQAGSVFFFESLPEHHVNSLAESDEERQLGWGCCLTGVWTDE